MSFPKIIRSFAFSLPFLICVSPVFPIYPVQASSVVNLTQQEKEWLAAHPVIRMAPDPDFPPIERFDENGAFVGIAADYVKMVEHNLGYTFTTIRCKSWDEILQKAKNHEIDVLSAAAQTPNRGEYLFFTEPHIVFPGVIITRTDVREKLSLKDLSGMKVGIVSGYVWQEFISRDYPKVVVDPVSDVQTGLKKVAFGMNDAMVENLATATHCIEKEGITNLHVAGETGYFTRLSFASRKDWPELNGILNKALNSITKDEKQAVYNKWIRLEAGRSVFNRTFWVILIAAISGVFLIIFFILLWSRSLQRLVRQRTDALAESERRYRFLFEESPAGSIIIAPDGLILDVNAAFLRILDFEKADVVGRRALDFIAPELREHTGDNIKRRFTGEHVPAEDVPVIAKDGSIHALVFARGQTIVRDNNRVTGLLLCGTDVTEQRGAEETARRRHEDLIRTDKLASLGILVSGVAHEINNPNNFIILNADNLRDIWKDTQRVLDRYQKDHGDIILAGLPYEDVRTETEQLISGISEGAKRIKNIVQNLKDFARQESGDMNQSVDVHAVIEAARVILGNLIRKSTNRFVFEPGVNTPRVKGNFQKIEQVVINLITNACQALSDRNQSIYVRTVRTHDPERLAVTIADEGMGISPENLKYIMDPFFTTKRDSGGTGLGLSISYSIIKDHGGDLIIESKQGKGTIVKVLLPIL
jgi:two-component system, cell cycle sensor histidine kinase and response regulator CckA